MSGAAPGLDWITLISSALGLAGSIAFALPAWRGLPDRRAYEAALAEWKISGDLGSDAFEAARDTFVSRLVGQYAENRNALLFGFACLGAAFLLPLIREIARIL